MQVLSFISQNQHKCSFV